MRETTKLINLENIGKKLEEVASKSLDGCSVKMEKDILDIPVGPVLVKGFTERFASELIDDFLAKTGFSQRLQQPKEGSLNPKSVSTAEVAGKYIASIRHSVSQASIETYTAILGVFSKQFPKLPLTPEPIEGFLETKSKRTAHEYHGTLGRFYLFLNKRLGVPNVMESVAKPKFKEKEADYLNLEQLGALRKQVENTTQRVLLELYGDHGLRLSEPLRLNIEDIQQDRVRIRGKRQERWMPILPKTIKGLRELANGRSGNQPVFLSRHKRRLSKFTAGMMLKELYRKAGITGIKTSANTLRHTFCTLIQEAGCDYGIAQALMRHKGDITSHYSHYSMDTLKRALEHYSPISQVNGSKPQIQINAN